MKWKIENTLNDRIVHLESENIETSNCIYELHNRIDMLEHIMYETLTEFERALARFGDKVGLIAGLEIADKISPEQAYQEIKELYKELKTLRKKEKSNWDD